MLIPRRVKYRKQHHPKRSGAATGGTGDLRRVGTAGLEPAYVTNRQIESARIAITRHIRRGGKVWINIYPDRPLTKSRPRPAWVPVRVARVVGPKRQARTSHVRLTYPNETLRRKRSRVLHWLPMKCRIVRREVSED